MRKCLKCNEIMIEDLELRPKKSGLKLYVANEGSLLGSNPIAPLKIAVCPKCGHVESYIQDTSKLTSNQK